MSAKTRLEQIQELLATDPADPFLRYGLALEYFGVADDLTAAAFADTPPGDWGIPEAVHAAIARHELPGAVVAVVRSGPGGDTVPYRQPFGRRSVDPDEPMTADTVFDLASLTKPIATSTSVM